MPKATKRIARYGQGRGEIATNAIYPLSTFLKRLGIGRSTLIMLRKRGFPVHFIGRRIFIDGQEAVDTFRQIFAQETPRNISQSDKQGENDGSSRTPDASQTGDKVHLRKKMEENRIVSKIGKKKRSEGIQRMAKRGWRWKNK